MSTPAPDREWRPRPSSGDVFPATRQQGSPLARVVSAATSVESVESVDSVESVAAAETSPAWVRRAERWLRYDSRFRQSLIVLAVAVATLRFVRPPDGVALHAVAYALVGVNVLLMVPRTLSSERSQRLCTLPYYLLAAGFAAAVLAVDGNGVVAMFGYFLAGNAGFRLPFTRAVAVATTTSTVCAAGVLVGNALDWTPVPWFVGLLTGTVVLIGIANRSRSLAQDATREAAEAQVQAATAQARAQTMAERTRIARDVHDVLAHSLAGINLQLELVDALLESGDAGAAREAAHRAQGQVREGLAEVSRTVRNLREDALPLVDTLAAVVAGGAPPGTGVEVVGHAREVPTPVSTALARVAQESLTNARKHAPDARVRVRLGFDDDAVALDVVNGAPRAAVNPLARTGSGLGLVGMRERIESVGGIVRTGPVVDGDDAGGWRVHARVPTAPTTGAAP